MREPTGGIADGTIAPKSPDQFSLVLERILALPDGDHILECIQCGTCGGSCPVSFAMDKTPRQVVNLVRSGRVAEALQSESIWICTSCYNCTVHCPAGIKITELMYQLKVASTEFGIHHEGALGPLFAESFVRQLESGGRINEVRLILRLAFRKPRLLFTLSPRVYFGLFRRGRVKLGAERVKGMGEIRKMNDWIISSNFAAGRRAKP